MLVLRHSIKLGDVEMNHAVFINYAHFCRASLFAAYGIT